MTGREGDDSVVAPEVRDMPGVAALPRANGHLVFEAPWQGRSFGTAVALVQGLGLDWEEFRRRLIAVIADDPDRPYYDSWAAALEGLAVDRDLITPHELDRRAEALEG